MGPIDGADAGSDAETLRNDDAVARPAFTQQYGTLPASDEFQSTEFRWESLVDNS